MSKGEVVPGATPNEPGADADAARWADLAKELGEEPAETPPPEDKGQQPPEGKTQEGEGDGDEQQPPPRGPVAPEEHENVKRALKAARDEARQVKDQLNGVTELINTLRTQRTAQQPDKKADEPAKLPSVEEDPIGHFTGQIQQLNKIIEDLQKGGQQTREQFVQSENQRQFVNVVAQSEQMMRSKAPDYDAACEHLEAGRVAELQAIYGDDNPQAVAMARHYGLGSVAELRNAILNQDRITVAQQAIMLGQSPAELYYKLATQRGYKQQQQQPPGKKPGDQQIDTARRGQRAAKSIGGGTGGGPDNPLSITDLTALYAEDPEAFDKEWDKMARSGKLG